MKGQQEKVDEKLLLISLEVPWIVIQMPQNGVGGNPRLSVLFLSFCQ